MGIQPRYVALAIAAVVFSACSSAPPSSTQSASVMPASAPASSPAATSAAPTETGAELTVDAFLALLQAGLTGLKSYHVDVVLEGKSIHSTGTGVVERVSETVANTELTLTTMGRTVTLLIYDGAFYVKTAGRWLKVDRDLFGANGATAGDIGTAIAGAKRYLNSVAVVGEEPINGVATTHYRVTMDAEALVRIFGSKARPKQRTFDWELWMDSSGLIHQAANTVKLSTGEVTNTTTMSRFNEPVTITPPKR